MRRRTRDEIDKFMAEHARLVLMLCIVSVGLLFLFSLGDWGWLLN